ncbi:MAG TPA: septal ring lytic transglycosylase RlpA family protein [Candidatus Acidoferrum sp.]
MNFGCSEGKVRNCSVLLALLLALVVSGCGGRRRVTASTPPPLQPSAAPPNPTENTARASTATTRPTIEQPPEGAYSEEGNASWYGAPFHGRRASNGEIYDMNKMTAAHRTMAFGTIVKVTNLTNGKTAVVRIIDRGPFVDNRIIDLSMAAAKEIESIGPGVVPVRLEVISGADPFGGFFTVQVGAFKEKDNAEKLRARLNQTYPPSTIQQVALDDGTFYRVRAGKISGERAAQKFADDLHSKEGFHTMVIRLDDAQAGGDR